ncbi:MAG: HEPN domain-containing protein, partial [Planctomycetes bacterium]|nr:HEPN domain-containing protein [Planctomycetota bacterium]
MERKSIVTQRYSPEDPREWLNRAHSNILRARAVQPGVYLEDLCFDAQQAAEKAIKALLIAREVDFPYVHDIAELLTLLEKAGQIIPQPVREAERLTRFAVFTRYPYFQEAVSPQEHQEAVAVADEVVRWAEGLIQKGNSSTITRKPSTIDYSQGTPMPKFKVVITDLGYPTYKYEEEQLKPVGAELVLTNCRTEDEVAAAIRDADGVIVRLAPCTAKAINATTRCKVIARYGVGVDNVDLAAATAKGICVANVPDYCWDEVSEHALALIFSCARKTVRHDRLVRKGEWDIGSRDPIYRMAGKTLGLLGFGNIARSLARKAQGLRFRILAHDPFVKPEVAQELGATLVDMDTLLRESDYISVHAPNTPQTRHLVNEAALRKMKRTAILVNTSRGPLVDEAALARA